MKQIHSRNRGKTRSESVAERQKGSLYYSDYAPADFLPTIAVPGRSHRVVHAGSALDLNRSALNNDMPAETGAVSLFKAVAR